MEEESRMMESQVIDDELEDVGDAEINELLMRNSKTLAEMRNDLKNMY